MKSTDTITFSLLMELFLPRLWQATTTLKGWTTCSMTGFCFFVVRVLVTGSLLAWRGMAQCTNGRRERRAWEDLSDSEQTAFLDAVVLLKEGAMSSIPTYDDFVNVHAENAWSSHSMDGAPPVEEFLTWHRWFIYQYESALQQVSGDCGLTLPYWNWETDSGNERRSSVLQSTTFGSVNGIRGRGDVTEGIADCSSWTAVSNNACVQRTFNGGRFTSTAGLLDRIVENPNYNEFFQVLEGAPHATPHNWVGGNMAGAFFSPDDPLFFLHHCNTDRIFALWQDYHGYDLVAPGDLATTQYSSRLIDTPMPFRMNGASDSTTSFFQNDGDYPTPRDVYHNYGIVQVTYIRDALAQSMVNLEDGVYRPNRSWFTLPGEGPSRQNPPVEQGSPPQQESPPIQPVCGQHNSQCQDADECCSGACWYYPWLRTSYCYGNGRRQLGAPFLDYTEKEDHKRRLRTRANGKPSRQHPRVFADSRTQQRLEELEDQGVDPKLAIHTIAKEECGENNGYSVPEAWVKQSGLDPKYFRCFLDGENEA